MNLSQISLLQVHYLLNFIKVVDSKKLEITKIYVFPYFSSADLFKPKLKIPIPIGTFLDGNLCAMVNWKTLLVTESCHLIAYQEIQ